MNIVYIIIDTLRADHLSCYGYFRKTSPNIDRLAEDGILFLNNYSEFPYTLPSFTSHITGICGIGFHYSNKIFVFQAYFLKVDLKG